MFQRKWIAAYVGLLILAGAFLWWRGAAVNLDPPKVLELGLLDEISKFYERIGSELPMGTERPRQDDDVVFFQALASGTSGPDGYILRYNDGTCPPITLPAGRLIRVDHVGPWISGVYATLPMEPLSFQDARAASDDIITSMMEAGWERSFYRPDVDEARIAESMGRRYILARLNVCGTEGTYAEVVLRSYGDGSPGFSAPPLAVGRSLPEDEPIRYLIAVSIIARDFDDATPNLIAPREDLVRARREAVTGNPRQAIPLSVWLEEPNWTP
ncbi:hypothetical protein [Tateyamaria sp. ANG-S1]|uniref:hypothetical protein n=1 Tax=Tateyamaria sp. ANG-S1 TaxID=1577905 RepID=UPI00057D87EF|nr:hypothetical protein [Tateyamaria sp. ANG-S1]KIC48003.1 hypothetical protein RA29_17500 [Tateyamaria sp. ANG-S1]